MTFDGNIGDSIPFLKPLLYNEGRIFILVDHINIKSSRKPSSSKLIAIDTSGNLLWENYFELSNKYGSARSTTPTIFNKAIIMGLGGNMTAVNADNGSLLWSRSISNYISFLIAPCVKNATIYSGTCENYGDTLFALKVSNGKFIWKAGIKDTTFGFNFNGTIVSAAIVNNKFIVNGRKSILAHDPATGAKLWEYTESNGNGDFFFNAVTSANGVIYTTDPWGDKIYAINSTDGSLKFTTGSYLGYNGSSHTQPVAYNDYLINNKFRSYAYECLSATNGLNIWNNIGNKDISAVENFVIRDTSGNAYYSTQSGMTQ